MSVNEGVSSQNYNECVKQGKKNEVEMRRKREIVGNDEGYIHGNAWRGLGKWPQYQTLSGVHGSPLVTSQVQDSSDIHPPETFSGRAQGKTGEPQSTGDLTMWTVLFAQYTRE